MGDPTDKEFKDTDSINSNKTGPVKQILVHFWQDCTLGGQR